MTNDELLRTFDELATSQDANADRIIALAGPSGMNDGLTETVSYLRIKAEECRAAAKAIRSGALEGK